LIRPLVAAEDQSRSRAVINLGNAWVLLILDRQRLSLQGRVRVRSGATNDSFLVRRVGDNGKRFGRLREQ
jgi:hypothetical protein